MAASTQLCDQAWKSAPGPPAGEGPVFWWSLDSPEQVQAEFIPRLQSASLHTSL